MWDWAHACSPERGDEWHCLSCDKLQEWHFHACQQSLNILAEQDHTFRQTRVSGCFSLPLSPLEENKTFSCFCFPTASDTHTSHSRQHIFITTIGFLFSFLSENQQAHWKTRRDKFPRRLETAKVAVTLLKQPCKKNIYFYQSTKGQASIRGVRFIRSVVIWLFFYSDCSCFCCVILKTSPRQKKKKILLKSNVFVYYEGPNQQITPYYYI